MKIDFCSDLHVDAWHNQTRLHDPNSRKWSGEPYESLFLYIDWREYKNPDSRVLVIAGDISNNLITTIQVIEAASAEYEHVVVVEGNHDHYDNDMSIDHGMEFLSNQLSRLDNVHYLKDDNSFTLDGVAFFGSTGWYNFRAYEDQGISDFTAKRAWNQYSNDSRFLDFNGSTVESLAATQAINLAEQVRIAGEDESIHAIVVTTHMSPRADLMEWKVGDIVWNTLTPSYVNTALDQVIQADSKNKIKLWIYGHTHHRQMREIEGVIYANNARGYPRENPPFTLTQIDISTK
jgi:UDP-2,3-diacylglucosamine pyrophosphatase LpxH